jgi:hypothetical protein
MWYLYGTKYLVCHFKNLAKVNEVGESLNPLWYFYVEVGPFLISSVSPNS